MAEFWNSTLCTIQSYFPGIQVCKEIWKASQTLIENILGFPDSCEQVCRGFNRSSGLAEAYNITQHSKQHQSAFLTEQRTLLYATITLIVIVFIQSFIIVSCQVNQFKRQHLRRKRKENALSSIWRKFVGGNYYNLPDIVTSTLHSHNLTCLENPNIQVTNYRYLSDGTRPIEENRELVRPSRREHQRLIRRPAQGAIDSRGSEVSGEEDN